MPNDDQTRWTVTVSKTTDVALRTFLAQRGLKKGDLSVFIEESVKAHILDLSKRAIHTPDAMSLDAVENIGI